MSFLRILPVAEKRFPACRSGRCWFDVYVESGNRVKKTNSLLKRKKLREKQIKEMFKMRVMVMIKANEDSEAGVMPSQELLTEMGNFNEQLVKAGVMLAGEGLHPSSKGARVRFSGDKRSVIDGPFAETKELIAGFWIWQVKSLQEAIEWVKRCPNPMGVEGEVEIRPIFEAEDFGAEFTPELREQEERLRKEIAEKETSK